MNILHFPSYQFTSVIHNIIIILSKLCVIILAPTDLHSAHNFWSFDYEIKSVDQTVISVDHVYI